MQGSFSTCLLYGLFPILCTQKTESNKTTELPVLWTEQKRTDRELSDSPSATDHHCKLPSAAWGCSCNRQTLKQVLSPALSFFCLCLCHSQLLRKSWSTAVVTTRCCQACRQHDYCPDCFHPS